MTADYLRILVIYMRPRDVPGCVVVRGHQSSPGKVQVEKGAIAFKIDPADPKGEHAALEAARRHCAALGLVRLDRHPSDDPVIVETWM
jgi:hypothetical protein